MAEVRSTTITINTGRPSKKKRFLRWLGFGMIFFAICSMMAVMFWLMGAGIYTLGPIGIGLFGIVCAMHGYVTNEKRLKEEGEKNANTEK